MFYAHSGKWGEHDLMPNVRLEEIDPFACQLHTKLSWLKSGPFSFTGYQAVDTSLKSDPTT